MVGDVFNKNEVVEVVPSHDIVPGDGFTALTAAPLGGTCIHVETGAPVLVVWLGCARTTSAPEVGSVVTKHTQK